MSNRPKGPKPIYRLAKFEYVAEDPDEELSFNEGDILEVLGKSEDSGWLKGKVRGTSRVALFPMNYTVVYEEDESEGEVEEDTAFNNNIDDDNNREQKNDEDENDNEEEEEEEDYEEEEEDDFEEYYPPKRTNRLAIPALNHVTLSRPKDTSKFAPLGKLNVPLPVLNHVEQQPSKKDEMDSEQPKGVLQLPALRKVEIPDRQPVSLVADNVQISTKLDLPPLRKVELPVSTVVEDFSTTKPPSFLQERPQLRHVSIMVKNTTSSSDTSAEEERNRLPVPQLRKVSPPLTTTNSVATTPSPTKVPAIMNRSNGITPMGFLPQISASGNLNKQQAKPTNVVIQPVLEGRRPSQTPILDVNNNNRRPSALGAGGATSNTKTFIPMPPAQTYGSFIPTSNNKLGGGSGSGRHINQQQSSSSVPVVQSSRALVSRSSEMVKNVGQQQSADKQFDDLLESKGHQIAGLLPKKDTPTVQPPSGFLDEDDKTKNNNNNARDSKPPLAGSVKIAGLRKHGKNAENISAKGPTSGVRTVSKQIPPRSLTMTEPPPSEIYTADVDSYSCNVQVNKTGKISEKIETFEITRADRSKVTLTIKQISGAPSASLEAVIEQFVKLSSGELDRIAQEHGSKIIAFCQFHFGRRVGDGECWSLAQKALEYADCAPPIGYNFGQQIELKDVKPGDVMQFKSCVFESPGSGKHFAGNPNHTAIVAGQVAGSMVPVFEQNPKPCSLSTYDLSTLTSGQITYFRPLPL